MGCKGYALAARTCKASLPLFMTHGQAGAFRPPLFTCMFTTSSYNVAKKD